MDWIRGLQKAIDYMEDNMTEEINYIDAAACACSSSFHFQRIFSVLTGISMGEYIRNRRLTLAGSELALTKEKVIDIALKYGYDSPESFTKAFTRFHGIPPSAAREPGARLNSFSRLSLKLIMEGGKMMNYRIEEKSEIHVLAKVKTFSTEKEIHLKEIPVFWNECRRYNDVLCGAMKKGTLITEQPALLGICVGDSCPGAEQDFSYGIGTETDLQKAPEGFEIIKIPAGTWAIFKCLGPMPGAIQALWKQIYAEFFPQSDYQPTWGTDFELYPDGDTQRSDYESEIWIPVTKKTGK